MDVAGEPLDELGPRGQIARTASAHQLRVQLAGAILDRGRHARRRGCPAARGLAALTTGAAHRCPRSSLLGTIESPRGPRKRLPAFQRVRSARVADSRLPVGGRGGVGGSRPRRR